MRRYNTKTLRWWMVAMLLVFFFCIALTTSASAEETLKYGYNFHPLNIRQEMDIESEWMGQYPSRSTIVILEDIDGWYRVENGFVMKEFVYDSVEIYQRGKIVQNALVFSEANSESQVIGITELDKEEIFIQKVNGYLERLDGGFVGEEFVTFSFEIQTEIKANEYTLEDMKTWKMPYLKIMYMGTLIKRTGGKGVTSRNTLYFKNTIPIYDIIDGEAYFPSGQHIYKISLDKFSEIENVGPSYDILAAYRTVYYNSSFSRKHNIALVSSFLDGTIIESGKTFSYNKTTGSRSASKGYQEAPVIVKGEYVMGYGGGVCQVSSTIYAAIMNQEKFRVTERREHGLPVSYLPTYMDATVSYGSIDLKFVNDCPFAVQLNVKSEDGVCLVTVTRVNE